MMLARFTPTDKASLALADYYTVAKRPADARQVLLARASTQLGVPVDRLTVTRGIVSVAGNPGQSVTYGALIGDRPFDVPYTGKVGN